MIATTEAAPDPGYDAALIGDPKVVCTVSDNGTSNNLDGQLAIPARDQFRTPSIERAPVVGQRKGTSSTFTQRQIGTVVGAARTPLLAHLLENPKLRRAVAQRTRVQIRTRGRAKTIELDDLALTNVRTIQEVRRPAAWARRATPSGLFIQRADLLEDDADDADDAKANGDDTYQVWHESALENSHLVVVSADVRFGAFTTQALDLQWSYDGMELQHIPDIVVELKSGTTMVVDCRDVGSRDNAVFATQVALTASMCLELGWHYELWDRLPSDLNCNLRDLENFVIVASPVARVARDVAASCHQSFRTVAGFKACAEERVDGGDATASLKHALWRGLVDVDLSSPICGYSELEPGLNAGRGLVLDGAWREAVVP